MSQLTNSVGCTYRNVQQNIEFAKNGVSFLFLIQPSAALCVRNKATL